MSINLINIRELYALFVQFPFICTDTRKIIPNSLFFCLKGENFDGNLFVNEALEKGARYVITEKKQLPKSEAIIVVDNVLQTLQQLAHYHRNLLQIPIIGITGTNGKTTTKELISSVLSKKYKTTFTQGNLNNHIGVPLTLLSIKREDEIAVVEMGANHSGEIAQLCQIALPDYGIITNIGKAHLEGFGTIEKIIETKTALYSAAKILFVNAEDEILIQNSKFKIQNSEIHFYGQNTSISGIILEMNPGLLIKLFDKKIQTHLIGNYNLPNILAAVAIGQYFGVSEEHICDAIAEYLPQNNRSQ
ncbi:MAG: Mur ligase domain-containing protein, partial [Bacteroidales bacterium]|nr:Mur ligase domain-containing protein [Bacteroidales bacterium]